MWLAGYNLRHICETDASILVIFNITDRGGCFEKRFPISLSKQTSTAAL